MKPWKNKQNWIQAGKALVTLVPAMVVYAVMATKGLVTICAENRSSLNLWCEVGSIGYVFFAIIIVRFFYVCLKPKEPMK